MGEGFQSIDLTGYTLDSNKKPQFYGLDREWNEIIFYNKKYVPFSSFEKILNENKMLRDAIFDAVKEVKSWYPLDIFPESNTQESKAAKMARHTCDNILNEIRKRLGE